MGAFSPAATGNDAAAVRARVIITHVVWHLARRSQRDCWIRDAETSGGRKRIPRGGTTYDESLWLPAASERFPMPPSTAMCPVSDRQHRTCHWRP